MAFRASCIAASAYPAADCAVASVRWRVSAAAPSRVILLLGGVGLRRFIVVARVGIRDADVTAIVVRLGGVVDRDLGRDVPAPDARDSASSTDRRVLGAGMATDSAIWASGGPCTLPDSLRVSMSNFPSCDIAVHDEGPALHQIHSDANTARNGRQYSIPHPQHNEILRPGAPMAMPPFTRQFRIPTLDSTSRWLPSPQLVGQVRVLSRPLRWPSLQRPLADDLRSETKLSARRSLSRVQVPRPASESLSLVEACTLRPVGVYRALLWPVVDGRTVRARPVAFARRVERQDPEHSTRSLQSGAAAWRSYMRRPT